MKYLTYAIEVLVLVTLVMCFDLGRSYIVEGYGLHPLVAGGMAVGSVISGLLAIWGFRSAQEDEAVL